MIKNTLGSSDYISSDNPHHQAVLDKLISLEKPVVEKKKSSWFDKLKELFVGSAEDENFSVEAPSSLERAIWRCGELGITEAAPRLVEYLGTGSNIRNYTVLWALALCGDSSFVRYIEPVVDGHEYPQWVQNIAYAALLNIAEDDKKEVYRNRVAGLLSSDVKLAYESGQYDEINKLIAQNGCYDDLTYLYLIDDFRFRPSFLKVIREASLVPPFFRAMRHIFKIAELRRDGEIFGIIAHKFETSPAMFNGRSGYGTFISTTGRYMRTPQIRKMLSESDSKIAFSTKTKSYLSRRVWRTLRRLGQDSSPHYAEMAIGVLTPYLDSDIVWRKNLNSDGHSSLLWAFNNLLYRNSTKYHRTNKYRWYKSGESEENQTPFAFPELWENKSERLFELLFQSHCEEVHLFALTLLKRDESFCNSLSFDQIIGLILKPYRETALFGLEKLYDNDLLNLDPGLLKSFLYSALSSPVLEVREKAVYIIKKSIAVFDPDINFILFLLESGYSDLQDFIKKLIRDSLLPSDVEEELREKLLTSEKNDFRVLGIELLQNLEVSELLQKQDFLWTLVTGRDEEIRAAANSVVSELAVRDTEYGSQLTQMVIATLLRRRVSQEVELSLGTLFKEKLKLFFELVPEEIIWKMVHSKSITAQEIGGILLPRVLDPERVSIRNLLALANNQVKSIRCAAWQIYEKIIPRVKKAMDSAVAIADVDWEDSRRFAYEYFEKHFSKEDFTPLLLISLCDSIIPETRQFGQKMINRYFSAADGEDYLLKLSEHPASDVQLFAAQYLEEYGSGSPEKLNELKLYFIRVLNAVNRGRKAKMRVREFLKNEALKSREAAEVVVSVMERQSASVSVEDRADALETLVDIGEKWHDLELPIRINEFAAGDKQ